jgi:hypothetical protein
MKALLCLLESVALSLAFTGCATEPKQPQPENNRWCKWCRLNRMAVCADDVLLPRPPDIEPPPKPVHYTPPFDRWFDYEPRIATPSLGKRVVRQK